MKVEEIKAALDEAGVTYPSDAKKTDLEALLAASESDDVEEIEQASNYVCRLVSLGLPLAEARERESLILARKSAMNKNNGGSGLNAIGLPSGSPASRTDLVGFLEEKTGEKIHPSTPMEKLREQFRAL